MANRNWINYIDIPIGYIDLLNTILRDSRLLLSYSSLHRIESEFAEKIQNSKVRVKFYLHYLPDNLDLDNFIYTEVISEYEKKRRRSVSNLQSIPSINLFTGFYLED